MKIDTQYATSRLGAMTAKDMAREVIDEQAKAIAKNKVLLTLAFITIIIYLTMPKMKLSGDLI